MNLSLSTLVSWFLIILCLSVLFILPVSGKIGGNKRSVLECHYWLLFAQLNRNQSITEAANYHTGFWPCKWWWASSALYVALRMLNMIVMMLMEQFLHWKLKKLEIFSKNFFSTRFMHRRRFSRNIPCLKHHHFMLKPAECCESVEFPIVCGRFVVFVKTQPIIFDNTFVKRYLNNFESSRAWSEKKTEKNEKQRSHKKAKICFVGPLMYLRWCWRAKRQCLLSYRTFLVVFLSVLGLQKRKHQTSIEINGLKQKKRHKA